MVVGYAFVPSYKKEAAKADAFISAEVKLHHQDINIATR